MQDLDDKRKTSQVHCFSMSDVVKGFLTLIRSGENEDEPRGELLLWEKIARLKVSFLFKQASLHGRQVADQKDMPLECSPFYCQKHLAF